MITHICLEAVEQHCGCAALSSTHAPADTVIIRFENDAVPLNSSFVPAPELLNATLQYQATHLDLNIYALDPGINATLYCQELETDYEIESCTEDAIIAVADAVAAPAESSAPTNDPDLPQQYGLTQNKSSRTLVILILALT